MPHSSWIPILCYHDVVPHGALAGATPYAIAEDQFTAQMDFLHKRGYRTISVVEAARYVHDGGAAPDDVVVITFDDGYESTLSRAKPILDRLGYTATIYLIADYLAQPEKPDLVRNPGVYLDQEGVRKLQAAGWELGSHTCTHPDLTTLPAHKLDDEVGRSRANLAAWFDDPIATFCYPYHRRSPEIEAQVVAAGYGAACGGYNTTHRLFNLSRINGALYSPIVLAARCSRWYWYMRRNPTLRAIKHAWSEHRTIR